MSIVKKLKAAETKAEALTADLAGAIEAKDAAEAALVDIQATHAAEIEKLQGQIAELTEKHTALEATISETQAQVQTLDAEKAEIQAQAEKLQRALDNPAHIDAAAPGEKPIEGASEGGEQPSLIEQLQSITDPAERRRFYLAHKAEIKAEQKNG